jgi:hypothetical protein
MVATAGKRPTPRRKPDETLVRMKAATVNRVELYMWDSGASITPSATAIHAISPHCHPVSPKGEFAFPAKDCHEM